MEVSDARRLKTLESENAKLKKMLAEQMMDVPKECLTSALRGQKMTMATLHDKLDRLLEVNDYPVFDGWKNFNKGIAEKHAKAELALYKKRKKIEAMGIEYDEEALAAGEYDDILIDG